MDQDTLDLLALTLIPGLGVTRLNRLIHKGYTANALLNMSRAQLRGLGLPAEMQVYIASGCPEREADKASALARKKGIRILGCGSEDYPKQLLQIYDPPLILYVLGHLCCLRQPSIAIVGSRKSTVYGREVTLKLSRELASTGLGIVSGLARGIDSQAHRGALETEDGTTTAVLGSGIDVIYPRENRKLYERIVRRGCVISEFPIGSFPAPQNFPIRNRIISGLSHGTLIPEAAEFSGSLITARLTLEQNRELWAVPGNITSAASYGPNYLIKQGAKPILTAQDVVDELPLHVLNGLSKKDSDSSSKKAGTLSESERRLLGLLSPDSSTHFDHLLDLTGLEIPKLSATLLSLEMKGLITRDPGQLFSRRL